MRRLLAYIMLTIFSFQIIPIKEIGKILFKSQLTEEIHEVCEDDCEAGDFKFKETIAFKGSAISYINQEHYFQCKLVVAIHMAAQLDHQHFPDIFVPPPNFIS